MIHTGLSAAILALVLVLSSSCQNVNAGIVTTISGTLVYSPGSGQPDSLGLDGADFEFSATFADDATWTDPGDGFVRVFSISHTITISGSTNGGDGVFADPDGLGFAADPGSFPLITMIDPSDFAGEFLPDFGGGERYHFHGAPQHHWNRGTIAASDGSPLIKENFAESYNGFALVFGVGFETRDNAFYSLENNGTFTFSSTAIPEPSSLLVAAAGLAFLTVRRRGYRLRE